MRKTEIEGWVLNIADRVKQKQRNEDFRVELKRIWPKKDPEIGFYKTAKQIAGQANVARGEPILWIIGLDEEKGVFGASHEELSSWWPQIKKIFDEGIYPSLTDLNVPYDGKTLVALYFETGRAPFVLKTPADYKSDTEVPWREGASTRSAHRSDMLRILVPSQELPKFELLEGSLNLKDIRDDEASAGTLILKLKFYVTKFTNDITIIPFRKCNVKINWQGRTDYASLDNLELNPPFKARRRIPGTKSLMEGSFFPNETASKTIDSTDSEVLISGPGVLNLIAKLSLKKRFILASNSIQVDVVLNPANIDRGYKASFILVKQEDSGREPWKFISGEM